MQREHNVYFVGKVLNNKEDPDDNAKTFAFSKLERASLAKQLRGIPVQMEHEDSLKVGEITNAWRDAKDQFWVYGRLKGDDLKSTFAKHAVQPKGSNQPYYGGLSLQHVHREYANGSSEKSPIEVSLVVEPRRRNCDIVWVSSAKPTKEKNYIGTRQAASSKQVITEEHTNAQNMSAIVAPTPTPTQPVAPAAEPAATAPATEQAAETAAPTEPTGLQLNEQVYSQMAELYEKDKKQQEELAKLREQLKDHQSQQEAAKAAKLKEDAAKGRALMSTMLEHMRDLLGANEEVQQLEPQLMPLMQSNPNEMNQLLEVVAKASKKYKNQSMQLKSAQNDLQEKELELKFQKLIKEHGMPSTATTEVASSRKRAAPVAAPVPAPAAAAPKQQQLSRNPYLRTAGPSRAKHERKSAMNKELLQAFMQNKAGGARQSMAKLHSSLQETMKQRNMYPTGRF